MSRLPSLGLVPIRPVAAPTDQFYTPSVKRSAGGIKLMQLAQALEGVAPEMRQILDRRNAAEIEAAHVQAAGKAAELAAKNITDFKKAVEQGLIAEQDNPWYMNRLRQEMARKRAENAAVQARADYYADTTGLRVTDDVAKVREFVRGRFNPLLAGATPDELAVMGPTLAQAEEQILNEHLHVRRGGRDAELAMGFRDNVASLLRGLDADTLDGLEDADDAAHGRLAEVAGAIQTELGRTLLVADRAKVYGWLAQAVTSEALNRKDDRLADAVLSRVAKEDGTPLSEASEVRSTVERVREAIRDYRRQRVREEEQDEKRAEDRAFKDLAAGFLARLNEARKANPNVSVYDVALTFGEIEEIDPDVRVRLEQLRNFMASTADRAKEDRESGPAREKVVELYTKYQAGTLTKESEVDLITGLLLLGKRTEVSAFLQDRRAMEREDDRDSKNDPETEIAFAEDFHAGRLTLSAVNAARRDGRLNRDGWLTWQHRALQAMAGMQGPGGGAILDDLARDIQGQVFARFSLTLGGYKASDVTESAEFRSRTNAAVAEFRRRAMEYLEANPTADRTTRSKELRAIADDVATRAGGYTFDEWRKLDLAGDQGLWPTQPKSDPSKRKPADEFVSPISQIDPVVGQVSEQLIDRMGAILRRPSTATLAAQDAPGTVPKSYTPVVGSVYSPQNTNHAGALRYVRRFQAGGPTSSTAGPHDLSSDLLRFIVPREDLARLTRKDPLGREATTPGGIPFDNVPEVEILVREAAIRRAAELERMIVDWNLPKQLEDAIAVIEERGPNARPTLSEKHNLVNIANVIREYADIRAVAGFDVSELKSRDAALWRRAPLFANRLDYERRGPQVAQALGLKGRELAVFRAAQEALLDLLATGSK